MTQLHCTNCGAPVEATWRHCRSCGAAHLGDGDTSSTVASVSNVPTTRGRWPIIAAAAAISALVIGVAVGAVLASGDGDVVPTASASSAERSTSTAPAVSTTTAPTTTLAPASTLPPTTVPATTPPPPTSPPEPTCATPPPKAGPEQAAKCLYEAYRSGDRASAVYFANDEVITKLFENPFEPPEWTFLGCDPPVEQNYDVCWFDLGVVVGAGHGVSAEMTVFSTPSAGSSVESLEFYG